MLGFPDKCSLKTSRAHLVAKRTVWPFVIIPTSPILDHDPGLWQALEEFGIETFTAQCAVETFVTTILPGFAGFDSARNNLLVFQEDCEVLGNKFWAVV